MPDDFQERMRDELEQATEYGHQRMASWRSRRWRPPFRSRLGVRVHVPEVVRLMNEILRRGRVGGRTG